MNQQQAAAEKARVEIREHVTHLLRQLFPNGHGDFIPNLVRELELHNDKNHDYAKGGAALGNFDRASAILALYPGLNPGDRRVYALILALKQIDAVLWGLAQNIQHKVEGLVPRLDDIAVYATIVKCMIADDTRNVEIDRQFGIDLHGIEGKVVEVQTQDDDPCIYRTSVSAQGVERRGPFLGPFDQLDEYKR